MDEKPAAPEDFVWRPDRLACDGFPRRGQTVRAGGIAAEAVERCKEIAKVIIVRRMGIAAPLRPRRGISWEDLLAAGTRLGSAAGKAEDPLLVLYSSGTTGRPKGILHAHCGFPVRAAQDMAFGTDVGLKDRIAWVTDIGWMMGPWRIHGAMLLGATIELYDGAPDYPDSGRLRKEVRVYVRKFSEVEKAASHRIHRWKCQTVVLFLSLRIRILPRGVFRSGDR